MNSETTRQVVHQFLDARAVGDHAKFTSLLAADVEWHLPASSGVGPFIGRDAVSEALNGGVAGNHMDVTTIRRDVHKMIVEGDTAVVLQAVRAQTLTGAEYRNEYCWIYTLRDELIVRLDEHVDTLHSARVFGLQ